MNSSRPLRVVLIDDCDLATEGIRALLAPYADRVTLVETRAALAAPGDLDVILFEPMDLSGMAASMLRDLQASGNGISAVFSWASPDALPATTVSTHITKRLSASQLVRTLEDLVEGRHVQVLPSRAPAAVIETPKPEPVALADGLETPLTPREADMIALITSGRSNLEISEHLGVSINSVKTYIRSAYRKIGITRRSQAVLWGVTHGYDTEDEAVTA
jgi:DNA-binding NarL/FixJ family response regulator